MKFQFIVVLCFYAVVGHTQDFWVQKDSVNGPPRSACASFVLDDEGFVIGGLDQIAFKRKMYSYDVDQDDWDNELSLGGLNGAGLNRGNAVGFSINDKGYIGLGQGNTAAFLSDLWAYDPETETWTQKADFIGSARRQAVAFSIDSAAYVGTGQDQNGLTNDFFKYDPYTNSWVEIAPFGGSPRKGAVGFTMGAQGYVGTGDDGVYTNDFWQYLPLTNTWHQKTNFPGNPRTGAVGWGIFPTAYIACGYDNTLTYTKDVWVYNYFSDTWESRADFIGSPRTNASAFVIQNTAYVGLGYDGDFQDDFYAYTPILSTQTSLINNTYPAPYPMPCQQVVYFDLNQKHGPHQIKIYDLKGQCLYTLNTAANGIEAIPLHHLSNGLYIYTITHIEQQHSISGKLIIDK